MFLLIGGDKWTTTKLSKVYIFQGKIGTKQLIGSYSRRDSRYRFKESAYSIWSGVDKTNKVDSNRHGLRRGIYAG